MEQSPNRKIELKLNKSPLSKKFAKTARQFTNFHHRKQIVPLFLSNKNLRKGTSPIQKKYKKKLSQIYTNLKL